MNFYLLVQKGAEKFEKRTFYYHYKAKSRRKDPLRVRLINLTYSQTENIQVSSSLQFISKDISMNVLTQRFLLLRLQANYTFQMRQKKKPQTRRNLLKIKL